MESWSRAPVRAFGPLPTVGSFLAGGRASDLAASTRRLRAAVGWARRNALGVLLWLLVTVAPFAGSVRLGVAALILGAAYILAEVWSERSGARHPVLDAGWRAFVRIGVGVLLIVVGFLDATAGLTSCWL